MGCQNSKKSSINPIPLESINNKSDLLNSHEYRSNSNQLLNSQKKQNSIRPYIPKENIDSHYYESLENMLKYNLITKDTYYQLLNNIQNFDNQIILQPI